MTDQLQAALGAFDPAVRPPVLPGGDVRYVEEDAPVGRLLLAARPDGRVLTCSYVPTDEGPGRLLARLAQVVSPRILRGGPVLDPVRRELAEYFEGRRQRFDVDLDLTLLTVFQRLVLTRLATSVEYGRTTSYGVLAREVGHPSAARAVGSALGANPLCVVLPCHRVLAASGALSGYAGGLDAKRKLLDLEASHPL